jgi:hypothetical protein
MVKQPQSTEIYYNSCARIDQNNKYRQAELMLERKVKTKEWWHHVSHTVLSMCVVDAYLLMVGCWGNSAQAFMTSRHFFEKLAEQLIDNTFETRSMHKKQQRSLARANPLAVATDQMLEANMQTISVTPTKKRKRTCPTRMAQGLCMVCKKPSTTVCCECQRFQPDARGRQFFICNKPGKVCMGIHIVRCHPHAVQGCEAASKDEDSNY